MAGFWKALVAKAWPYLVGIALGLAFGWVFWRPKPVPLPTPAPAVVQKDSSIVLQRAPDAHAKPPVVTPKGAKVERIVQLKIVPQPETTFVHDTVSLGSGKIDTVVTCPPVAVDLTVNQMTDRTQRVVAKAVGGQIVGSIDIPVYVPAATRSLDWSAGAIYDANARAYGGLVTRDVGPLRVSLGVTQKTVLVGLGIRF